MKQEIITISQYLKKLGEFKLPSYDELPPISLYMEQVVSYVDDCLNPLFENDNNDLVTPFMVNNYVKAKIIDAPSEKKYNKNHIGYLMAISLLKSVVPMKDIATFIDLDKHYSGDRKNLYNFFKSIQEESIEKEVHKVKIRLDSLLKDAKKNSKLKDTEFDENLNLAYVALRLYIESETAKMFADKIMSKLSSEILPKKVLHDSKKQKTLTKKQTSKEAKKIGARK